MLPPGAKGSFRLRSGDQLLETSKLAAAPSELAKPVLPKSPPTTDSSESQRNVSQVVGDATASKLRANRSTAFVKPNTSRTVVVKPNTSTTAIPSAQPIPQPGIKSGSAAKLTHGEHESMALPVGMPDVRGPAPPVAPTVPPHPAQQLSSSSNSTAPPLDNSSSGTAPGALKPQSVNPQANAGNVIAMPAKASLTPAPPFLQPKSQAPFSQPLPTTSAAPPWKQHPLWKQPAAKAILKQKSATTVAPPQKQAQTEQSAQPAAAVLQPVRPPPPRIPPAPGIPVIPAPVPAVVLPEEFRRVELAGGNLLSPYTSQGDLDHLWSDLFDHYRKTLPPIPLDGGPLAVGVGINFVKFKDIDEVAGTMNIALCIRLCWDDARLSFDSMKYFNKSWTHQGDKLPVQPQQIWTPDVTVLNGVGGFESLLDIHSSPIVLSDDLFRRQTGVNLLWSRPLDVQVNCEVDMRQYPFDQQSCFIVVGSWTSSRREMLLIPQPFFAEYTIHSSEFQVVNITVHEEDVYTHGTAQMFNEVVYKIVLQRYPHYHLINFILPMLAVTLLTIATMWMNPAAIGPRVNSATKLLLCVVSIIFITARSRPALHGDIWMDRFQSHCLALSMSSVLESLFIDHIKMGGISAVWLPCPDRIDAILRALICGLAAVVVCADARQVQETSILDVRSALGTPSTQLLVGFIYLLALCLVTSSAWAFLWLVIPKRWLRRLQGMDEDQTSSCSIGSEAVPLLLHVGGDDDAHKFVQRSAPRSATWSPRLD